MALKKHNDELLTKVIHDLELLREFGLELLGQDRVKKITEEVFELRTKRGSDINRILFGTRNERILLLATSFVKKSQRTPKEKIEVALRRLAEWEN
ncbi:MAG: type II toxin-antitoxin system RelE/ParE family toxin [Actinobacteria bacterium]|nr:type II toxin-antitoxin system RelE/ParE family toxin [Actinomycetota bacterium]